MTFTTLLMRIITVAIVAVLAVFNHVLWSTPSLEPVRASLLALGVTCALLGFGPALVAEAVRSQLTAIELELAELRAQLHRASVIADTEKLRKIR